MTETPQVLRGLSALRRDNPWPQLPADVEPFYLSLDGGGRNLITDLIREREVTLMLEIGCFMCGSARQWLSSSPNLEIIGVDPWDANWAPYVRKMAQEDNRMLADLERPTDIADIIQKYGNYVLALNNIRDIGDRFIPVRQRSPEALHYLSKRKIEPDLIYIDAFKSDEDLWVAHRLFPDALLCGDDWTWRDEDGRYRMREHVERFAAEHRYYVRDEAATWVVSTEPHPWNREAVDALLKELDPAAQELLRFVASAARSGVDVTFDASVQQLRRGGDVLLGATQRINDAPECHYRPQPLGLGGTGDGWGSIGERPFVLADGLATLL